MAQQLLGGVGYVWICGESYFRDSSSYCRVKAICARSLEKASKRLLKMAFQNETRVIVDQLIVRCFYVNGLAFNVVCSPYLQQTVKRINEAQKGTRALIM